jgi:acetylglutamate kinase
VHYFLSGYSGINESSFNTKMKFSTSITTLFLVAASASAFVPLSPKVSFLNRAAQVPSTVLHQVSDEFAGAALTISQAASSLRGKTIVVKYGGNAMTSEALKQMFCQDVAALQNLGIRVVVVHGGGPQINALLEKVGVESRFEGGMRVSSKEVVDVAEMALCGQVNKEISSKICSAGGRAIGISGRDDSLLKCTKQINKDGYDLGFVGQVETVNTKLLQDLLDIGLCPVVSPIGTGIGEEADIAYNVNADVAAGRIAGEIRAARVLFLTDIAGVLDKEMKLLKTLTVAQVDALIADETITGGMIPKVSFATSAVQLGVSGAFITDGRVPHALLKEVLGGGAGGMGSGDGGTVVTL